MEAHCGQTELTESLKTKAFQAHTPAQKAAVLLSSTSTRLLTCISAACFTNPAVSRSVGGCRAPLQLLSSVFVLGKQSLKLSQIEVGNVTLL